MRRRQAPARQNDESGQCRHLYLTGDAVCVHCGIKFTLAWASERSGLLRPSIRNLIYAVISGALMALTLATMGDSILSTLLLLGVVLFFTRTFLHGLEIFGRHRFVPGVLGLIFRRSPFNILAAKPYIAMIGTLKVPIDLSTYEHFQPGDTLLIEHLRWSRLPVAIYKGSYS